MLKNYYIKRAGKILGPFSTQEVRDLGTSGQIASTDLIKKEHGPWIPAPNIKGLTPPPSVPTQIHVTPSHSLNDNWYAQTSGQPIGPCSSKLIVDLINNSKLTVSDMVWREGMAEWKPIIQIPELCLQLPSSIDLQKSNRISSNTCEGLMLKSKRNTIIISVVVVFFIFPITLFYFLNPLKTENREIIANKEKTKAEPKQLDKPDGRGENIAAIKTEKVNADTKSAPNNAPEKNELKTEKKIPPQIAKKEKNWDTYAQLIAYTALVRCVLDNPSEDIKKINSNENNTIRKKSQLKWFETYPKKFHTNFLETAKAMNVDKNPETQHLLNNPKEIFSTFSDGKRSLRLDYGHFINIIFSEDENVQNYFKMMAAKIGDNEYHCLAPETISVNILTPNLNKFRQKK